MNTLATAAPPAAAPEAPPLEAPAASSAKAEILGAAPAPTVETVPLASIDAEGSPFRFRRSLEADAKIRALAASIREKGLLNPLAVLPSSGGKFTLVAGFRRHAALLLLAPEDGKPPQEAPVRVQVLPPGTTKDQALGVALDENGKRKSLDSTERAIALVRIHDRLGKPLEEVATILGLSERHFRRMRTVATAYPEVQEALLAGRLPLLHAEALANVHDAGVRAGLFESARAKRLGVEEIRKAAGVADAADPLDGIAAEAREFVRVGESGKPDRPLRFTAFLKTAEAARRVARYVSRLAS